MSSRNCLIGAIAVPLLLLAASAPPARAGDFGVRGGLYLDDNDPFLGVEWLGDFRGRWDVNPNLEVVFPDHADRFSLNLDFHRDFSAGDAATFWLGAGAGLIFTDPDNPRADEETDGAINVLAGIGARNGAIRPYGQLKLVFSDDSEVVIMAGLRF